jgi:hypothetical protein
LYSKMAPQKKEVEQVPKTKFELFKSGCFIVSVLILWSGVIGFSLWSLDLASKSIKIVK